MSSLIRNVYYQLIPIPWVLERSMVKSKYSNWNSVSDFLYLITIVMLALSDTISKIFGVKIVHDHNHDLYSGSWSNENVLIAIPTRLPHMWFLPFQSPSPKYLISKCEWPWPLEWAKFKCKYVKSKKHIDSNLMNRVIFPLSPLPRISLWKCVWPWPVL